MLVLWSLDLQSAGPKGRWPPSSAPKHLERSRRTSSLTHICRTIVQDTDSSGAARTVNDRVAGTSAAVILTLVRQVPIVPWRDTSWETEEGTEALSIWTSKRGAD